MSELKLRPPKRPTRIPQWDRRRGTAANCADRGACGFFGARDDCADAPAELAEAFTERCAYASCADDGNCAGHAAGLA